MPIIDNKISNTYECSKLLSVEKELVNEPTSCCEASAEGSSLVDVTLVLSTLKQTQTEG